MSSLSDTYCRPLKKLNRGKKKSVFCSTPVKNVHEPSSTSASTIDAGSTSSANDRRITKFLGMVTKKQQRNPKKKTVPLKKKTKLKEPEVSSCSWVTTSDSSHDEKENLLKKKREETKLKKSKVSGSGVIIISDCSDDEKENLQSTAKTTPKLFSDLASPDSLREYQHFSDFCMDPPISQSLRKSAECPKKIQDYKRPLIAVDLSSLETHVVDTSDDEEENLSFKKEVEPRVYRNTNVRRKLKSKIEVDKTKRWLVDVKVPTAMADMLWDDYVAKHPEEMIQWIASPSKTKPMRIKDKADTDAEDENNEKRHRKELLLGFKLPEGMSCVRGFYDRVQKKWIHDYESKYDVYKFPQPEDSEFERNPVTMAPKLSLSQYLKKSKARKRNLERKKMLNEISFDKRSDQNSDQEFVVNVKKISRKRKNERNTSDVKRIKMAEKSVLTIKSVETLIGTHYKISDRKI